MPQPHPRGRRVRASKPKVRTGCITCKLRRVKCDEGKPYCLRCQKFGVLCEGYAPIPPKGSANTSRTSSGSPPQGLPETTPPTTTPTTPVQELALWQHPAMNLFADEQQSLYFRVFCDRTSSSLSGFYDADLWGRLILQASHQQDFVREAVVALGALDRTMEAAQQLKTGISITGVDTATSLEVSKQNVRAHHEYALQHYNKSIALMRNGLSDENHGDERQLRNILISCLLIVCFEIFHGNMDAALFQAQIGVNLLSEWLQNCPDDRRGLAVAGIASPKPTIIEDELIQAFARLERQCLTFLKVDMNRSREVVRECFFSFKNIPEQFSSLKEARAYFFLLDRFSSHSTILLQAQNSQSSIYGALAYRRFGQKATAVTGEAPVHHVKGEMPPMMRQGLKAHQQAFSRWITAFQPVLERSRTPAGADDALGATILHMRSKVNVLSSLRAFSDEKSFHEKYLGDFVEIVTLSKEVLEQTSQSQTANRTRFMFDANIIGMLFFICNFCRDRLVRRQSIELLEAYPGREGAWDSSMAAALGRWTIQIEEAGLGDDEHYVPESRKIHMINLQSSLADRQVMIDYYLPGGQSGEVQQIHHHTLTW